MMVIIIVGTYLKIVSNNYRINFIETGTPPPYLPLELGDWEKT